MSLLKITSEDLTYFRGLHPDKSSITLEYRQGLFKSLTEYVSNNIHKSDQPIKEFYEKLPTDFQKVKPSDKLIDTALKMIAIQVSISGRIKIPFMKIDVKHVVGLSLYLETGKKGDVFYALADTVLYVVKELKQKPGIVQWIENSGFELQPRDWCEVIPRSHVLINDALEKAKKKADIELLIKSLNDAADLSKVYFSTFKINRLTK
jgi:hypothetical protein